MKTIGMCIFVVIFFQNLAILPINLPSEESQAEPVNIINEPSLVILNKDDFEEDSELPKSASGHTQIWDVGFYPTDPHAGEDIIIKANVYDPAGVLHVKVLYNVCYRDEWHSQEMILEGCYLYTANIGSFLKNEYIRIKIEAEDIHMNGISTFCMKDGFYVKTPTPGSYTEDLYLNNFIQPVISNVKYNPLYPSVNEDVEITAEIYDPNGMSQTSITYRNDTIGWTEISMVPIYKFPFYRMTYRANIGKQLGVVEFFLYAWDNSFERNQGFDNNLGSYYSFNSSFEPNNNVGPNLTSLDFLPKYYQFDDKLVNISVDHDMGIDHTDFYYKQLDYPWTHIQIDGTDGGSFSVNFTNFDEATTIYFYFISIENSSDHFESIFDNNGQLYQFEILEIEDGKMDLLEYPSPGDHFSLIRVFDLDRNINRSIQDTVKIKVTSSSDTEGIYLSLFESSRSSGIFTNNLNYKPYSDNNSISVQNADTITLEYIDPLNLNKEQEISTISYSWFVGKTASLDFDQDQYEMGEKIRISIMDSDVNINPNFCENTTIRIFSALDRNGFPLIITETDINSGIFTGEFEVNESKTDASRNQILCWDSWEIFAEYEDKENGFNATSILREEATYCSPTFNLNYIGSYLPLSPMNGDSIRFYVKTSKNSPIKSVAITSGIETYELKFQYASIYENLFSGWIVVEENDLLFTYVIEITYLNGTKEFSLPKEILLHSAHLNVKSNIKYKGENVEFSLNALNIKKQYISNLTYEISSINLDSGEIRTIDRNISKFDIFTYQLNAENANLSFGKWMISINISKPGYIAKIKEYFIEVAYGFKIENGWNQIYLSDGSHLQIGAWYPFWLVLNPIPTPNIENLFNNEYIGLNGSFLEIYIYLGSSQYKGFPIRDLQFSIQVNHPDLQNTESENLKVLEKIDNQWGSKDFRYTHNYIGGPAFLRFRFYKNYFGDVQTTSLIYYTSFGMAAKKTAIRS